MKKKLLNKVLTKNNSLSFVFPKAEFLAIILLKFNRIRLLATHTNKMLKFLSIKG